MSMYYCKNCGCMYGPFGGCPKCCSSNVERIEVQTNDLQKNTNIEVQNLKKN
ncbi:MAG: hypothetical protein BWY04_01179 [candidate division CPR1 bacterium ADurb.Bin160]|uniref:Uncharacterized protein n=1 Tax=candidate division CPR1 bacterium ADurb.Bin160 TaxID=1852826 RepID=A0A1V5ZKV9_9BACT|nr:MAG: hypothetical protein BWY04_01179 [candidate division CPR1 bacterium ADurb.Bin160]